MMDEFSGYTDCFPCARRNEKYVAAALNKFAGPDKVIISIYSDGAPEFHKACQKLRPEGVVHDISTPYRHTAGAKIERRNRLVLDGTRTAVDASGIGVAMWPRAVRHFCFAYNAAISWAERIRMC